MILPYASRDDLLLELREIDERLALMDSAVIVNEERWFNLRETRLEHRRDIAGQLAALVGVPGRG